MREAGTHRIILEKKAEFIALIFDRKQETRMAGLSKMTSAKQLEAAPPVNNHIVQLAVLFVFSLILIQGPVTGKLKKKSNKQTKSTKRLNFDLHNLYNSLLLDA